MQAIINMAKMNIAYHEGKVSDKAMNKAKKQLKTFQALDKLDGKFIKLGKQMDAVTKMLNEF